MKIKNLFLATVLCGSVLFFYPVHLSAQDYGCDNVERQMALGDLGDLLEEINGDFRGTPCKVLNAFDRTLERHIKFGKKGQLDKLVPRYVSFLERKTGEDQSDFEDLLYVWISIVAQEKSLSPIGGADPIMKNGGTRSGADPIMRDSGVGVRSGADPIMQKDDLNPIAGADPIM